MSSLRTASIVIGAPILLIGMLWLTGYISFVVVSPYDGGEIPGDPCHAFAQQAIRSYLVLAVMTASLSISLYLMAKREWIGRPSAVAFLAVFFAVAFLEVRYLNLESDGPAVLGFWARQCDSYASYERHYFPF